MSSRALAQRRQHNRKHENAVVEILAKSSLPDLLFQIAMRRDDDAHVHGKRLVAADALDFAFFQHAQQFRLHRERHVANFVEEQRAVMGLLEFSDVARGRAGERAFFVAEQLRFHQLGGNRGAIQRDKGSARRGLFSCSVRAINSLPVPVSPRMQTRVSLAATCSTCAITSRIAGLAQTM